MRSSRVLTGAALSVAALGLSTTAAFAGDFGTIEVSPGTARAGSTVSLTSSACRHGTARVDASSLGAGTVRLAAKGRAHSGNVQGSLRIPYGTRPGNYGIGGACSHGKDITGTIGVVKAGIHGGARGAAMGGGGPAATASSSATPAPKGKAKTGVGTESSSGTELAAGAAMLMAAVAGGIWVMRHRREGGRP
ncbi:hypothetical protein FCH28_21850 [Streptomyces piniterrae]|uniref:LPXTG cell wall anchor domain-containing protein n=1 Tax=Streptomyces piniterrae TaxID=2571125 RepID=A0A4U0NB72_9ACTN|nr:hypothetical protein [Streptomyces piniterrae]TJZ51140.1 hypothetical protein FCH28_21850 [Streptomyces piniterrae]